MTRGQFMFIPWLVLVAFFIAFWVLAVAPFVNTTTQDAITTNQMSGIEAFLLAGMNVWILLAVILGVIVVIYFGVGG
jgi:hypothetical protein